MGARTAPYLRAPAGAATALVLRLMMNPVLGSKLSYTLFLIAVAWSGLYDGLGPGVLSALLGAVASAYFLIPPYQRLMVEGTDNSFVSSFLPKHSGGPGRGRKRPPRSGR